MSTTVFSFTVAQPYREDREYPIDVSVGEGGRKVRKKRLPSGVFRVHQAAISFPRNSLATWDAFWKAREGGYDSFLYKAVLTVHNTITGEALGTSSGGAGESFALDSKHIDASTLVVKVGGVDQVGDWSLSGNDTAPQVDTGAGFDAGTVTADYEFYYPCVFDQPGARPAIKGLATTAATSLLRITTLTWSQDRSGSHLV